MFNLYQSIYSNEKCSSPFLLCVTIYVPFCKLIIHRVHTLIFLNFILNNKSRSFNILLEKFFWILFKRIFVKNIHTLHTVVCMSQNGNGPWGQPKKDHQRATSSSTANTSRNSIWIVRAKFSSFTKWSNDWNPWWDNCKCCWSVCKSHVMCVRVKEIDGGLLFI